MNLLAHWNQTLPITYNSNNRYFRMTKTVYNLNGFLSGTNQRVTKFTGRAEWINQFSSSEVAREDHLVLWNARSNDIYTSRRLDFHGRFNARYEVIRTNLINYTHTIRNINDPIAGVIYNHGVRYSFTRLARGGTTMGNTAPPLDDTGFSGPPSSSATTNLSRNISVEGVSFLIVPASTYIQLFYLKNRRHFPSSLGANISANGVSTPWNQTATMFSSTRLRISV
jgi:hypothetical protein